jgi:hypothetical protein
MTTTPAPDLTQLGNWLTSWVRPSGAIYGFNNHSVWGANPYRMGDFTAGHSTWSSPYLAGISEALTQHSDPRGLELLERLIDYQTTSFQEGDVYRHIGYETGELSNKALIHNAIANVSLGLAAVHGHSYLDDKRMNSIRTAILRNMKGCESFGSGRPDKIGTCNQEYARIWGKLLFQQAFDDTRWRDEVVEDIDYMIQNFHLTGFPDDECTATLRATNIPDIVEPAEYYGLMICPLVLAAELYQDDRYLDEAGRICRHVARSQWIDEKGQVRFHRLWFRANEEWKVNNTPMLIAGMGDSLEGINRYLKHRPDAELENFLLVCDQTYSHYQHPRGFFASATGWLGEADIAPSTAWHSHDFRSLVHRHGIDSDFWDTIFQQDQAQTSVLLGDRCYWIEQGPFWAIRDYLWECTFDLVGRKDRVRFGRSMPDWIEGGWHPGEEYDFSGQPAFIQTDDFIAPWEGDMKNVVVRSIAKKPYVPSL